MLLIFTSYEHGYGKTCSLNICISIPHGGKPFKRSLDNNPLSFSEIVTIISWAIKRQGGPDLTDIIRSKHSRLCCSLRVLVTS